jgi:hypothetical protein
LKDDFKQQLIDEYLKDQFWSKVLCIIKHSDSDETDPLLTKQEKNLKHGLWFFQDKGLIYFIDQIDNRERLCIPAAMEKEVIALAHDNCHHTGYK